ncbi:winged helix DNA-binding domain-containing protein [Ornithinimicrobium pratense]|uniref:winged helix DNA-binding domain-containing protein n=1 Tax=Ornithinimicrobium pratense TaxID=2593973 RepID=UPI001EE2BC7A|nr:winged helix DNA-binding domain-containing protein [Ornithinimicrobium pratense]
MSTPDRLVTDRERRARLARRHALHPDHRVRDTLAATRAMTVLHATEASSVHLAVQARTDQPVTEVERALYEERSVVKQLAMRRTLFAFPRDLLPAALGSAAARVAAEQRRLVARDVEQYGIAPDGQAWLEQACAAVLDHLGSTGPRTARQLREELPALAGTVTYALDRKYGGTLHIAPRVLTTLGAEGLIVRGRGDGHWRTSRPTWTLGAEWLGAPVTPASSREGYAELVRRWLRTFGPGTLEDVQWWLGSTKTAARTALADVDAVEVGLERGRTGWLLPDDLEEAPDVEPWAALLPSLDPTTMGWKERDFYLDPRRTAYLFDSNGNGGTTAWWDGQVVGAWVQDPEGVVRVVPAPGVDLGADARRALDATAGRLTTWLDGTVISNIYKSALMKGERLP